ncbi:hypothetical protein F5883DRAFT_716537 [Diaporthe sp. PMI_573]|nr:hypothetical protein F5883DRAFT_716537 [Diaporthaceae sp. PMI_573]
MAWEIPEPAVCAVDVELTRGNGAVLVVVDSGPADVIVAPAADPVAHAEVVELIGGNGGERLFAEDAAVSFRRADEVVVPKLVGSVASGTENVALADPALEVECGPVPVTRVPVDINAEVVLVRGNGAGLVLVLSTPLVGEVDLLVVKMRVAFVVLDADNTVCRLGPTVNVVLLRGAEELKAAEAVTLGVKIDRGNVLRIDRGVEAGVSVDLGEDVMGGKLVSIVTLVRFPGRERLDVKVGSEVAAAEEVLVAEAVSEVVNSAEDFLEKEFLSVKPGPAEVFKASALVSVAPGSVEESFDARLVKVEVETEVDVVTIKVVDVIEVGIVVTVHGPLVCHGLFPSLVLLNREVLAP